MRLGTTLLIFILGATSAGWTQSHENPVNPKAQKSFAEGAKYEKEHKWNYALDSYRDANKKDGGACLSCQQQILKLALKLDDYKLASETVRIQIAEAHSPAEAATAHCAAGMVFLRQGQSHKNVETFERADREFQTAIATANIPEALLGDGMALAYLMQDEPAKARFLQYVKAVTPNSAASQRGQKLANRPELARARIAPSFEVTTLDGKRLTLDDLEGKVVLLDFWATWCGPCREAIPHMKRIQQAFKDQPLVLVSVSLDTDDQKWRDFVAKNGMTWVQAHDAGFSGPLALKFGVEAIPHTFTIDADGVLQDEHIGDASIEGKLKKLVSQAKTASPNQTLGQ